MKPQISIKNPQDKSGYFMIKNTQTFVKERGDYADTNDAMHLARARIDFLGMQRVILNAHRVMSLMVILVNYKY
jgi:hypothetical protein